MPTRGPPFARSVLARAALGARRISLQNFGLATSGNWKPDSNSRSSANFRAIDSDRKISFITDRCIFYFKSEKYFISKKVFI
jgi:hypothetical protein